MVGRFVIGSRALAAGVGARAGARPLSVGSLPIGGSHGEFPDVLVRMEHDDVHFGYVEADEGHRSAETDRQTHGRNLNLRGIVKLLSHFGVIEICWKFKITSFVLAVPK